MIQKRFQYYSRTGIAWTEWFDYDSDDSKLATIQANEPYQFGKKLRNEFRIVNN